MILILLVLILEKFLDAVVEEQEFQDENERDRRSKSDAGEDTICGKRDDERLTDRINRRSDEFATAVFCPFHAS